MTPAGLAITRCVCMHAPFTALLPLAREHGWDLEALVDATGCGDQCGLCRPYLREMLRSGTTEFHEILTEPPSGAP